MSGGARKTVNGRTAYITAMCSTDIPMSWTSDRKMVSVHFTIQYTELKQFAKIYLPALFEFLFSVMFT